jgi:hypothetical protein
LGDINHITVRAAYHGKTYTAVLGITKARGGNPSYTWIKYADNAQGGGLSDNPDGKKYIGLAHNKATATESNNPADYTWSLIKGPAGDAAIFPKYRGVTKTADTGNTGKVTINGVSVTMNDLDRVLYMGDTGNWTKARLYQWHKAEQAWVMIIPEKGTLEYMEALRDITAGAPDGIFSNVFCEVLFAQQAAINTLQSQLIQILNGGAIFGGERFTKNGQNVVDNDPTGSLGASGFMLDSEGRLQASNAEIRGLVNSKYGIFEDVTITGNSKFYGEIDATVLIANKEPSYSESVRSTGINKDVKTFIKEEFNYWGLPTNVMEYYLKKDIDGTYKESGVKNILYYLYNGRAIIDLSYILLTYYDDTTIEFRYDNSGVGKISNLQFRYASLGTWKVQMKNLPTSDPKVVGVLWRDGTDLKISNG